VLSASAQAKHIATYSLARSSNGTKMVSRQRERVTDLIRSQPIVGGKVRSTLLHMAVVHTMVS
jgi:hypothetical protein